MSAALLSAAMLDDARRHVAEQLTFAVDRLRDENAPNTSAAIGGRLLRPVAGYAVAREFDTIDDPYWMAMLAVQLAHEASLLHDDVVDQSASRRAQLTAAAQMGPARALLAGDHVLAHAYRAAAATNSLAFITHFGRAVERTIAAERRHSERLGQPLSRAEYEAIAAGKSGELIGCALGAAPLLRDDPRATALLALGRRAGLAYQMADDLLDYCLAAPTGKPALADYTQNRWTWPLDIARDLTFGRPADDAALAMRRPRAEWDGATALGRCLERLEQEFDAIRREAARLLPHDALLAALVDDWRERVRRAVAHEEDLGKEPRPSTRLWSRVPPDPSKFLARHSRSFALATRLLPRPEADRITSVYAFCRVTDDIVDRPDDTYAPESLLDQWLAAARLAYAGKTTGLVLVDRTMADMATSAVPFDLVEQLIEGVRMDLRGTRYASLDELRTYTYRVASVIGLWIAGLEGVRDERVLSHAALLGHAMQLTNIVRDVGEDWAQGRLYVPLDVIDRNKLTTSAIAAMAAGERPISDDYRACMEELMTLASVAYRTAFPAILELPVSLHRAVAVAARVYEGIHVAIRRNDYDNLHRRAYTASVAKIALATRALRDLHRAERRATPVPAPELARS